MQLLIVKIPSSPLDGVKRMSFALFNPELKLVYVDKKPAAITSVLEPHWVSKMESLRRLAKEVGATQVLVLSKGDYLVGEATGIFLESMCGYLAEEQKCYLIKNCKKELDMNGLCNKLEKLS